MRDITNMLERLEAFEDRVGVTLEALFATMSERDEYDNTYEIRVKGELHPQEGTELARDVDVVVATYDTTGRVIDSSEAWFDADSFFGFEIFSERLTIDEGIPVAKVRIYPKAR